MQQETDKTQFGVHLMFDGYEASEGLLGDRDALEQLLHDIPQKMNMHKLCEPTVLHLPPISGKDPGGCSGFVLIAESHISFHTFPKRGFVTADIYTCQTDFDVERFTKILKEAFGTKREETIVLPRGLDYPVSNIYT